MHAAAAIALIGCLSTITGVITFVKLMTSSEQDEVKAGVSAGTTPAEVRADAEAKKTVFPAAVAKTAMSAICLIFVGFCVKSFIDARKARLAGAPSPEATPPASPA
jgi:hypothetical protein